MQPKNLGWKFAFVGLLIAMSVYAIYAKGLRQGIDLKGGHILVFEVQAEPGQAPDLIQQVISTLKQRIDPNGLYMLEWKPVGTNRFEVRMPLGSDEAVKARQAYLAALDELQDQNMRRSEVQEVASPGPQRQRLIDQAEKSDPARADALRKAAAAADGLAQARQTVDKLQAGLTTDEVLAQAERARDDALAAYNIAVDDVYKTNVDMERLGRTLALYVADREVRSMPRQEVTSRRSALAAQLEQLRKDHRAAVKYLDAAYAAYRNWSEKRSGLDDPADLKRLIASAGVLEFRIAPTPPGSGGLALSEGDYETYMTELREQGPLPGRTRNNPFQWFAIRPNSEERLGSYLVVGQYAGKKYVLLYNQLGYMMVHEPGVKSWSLSKAYRTSDDVGRPAVGFEFDPRGASLMGELTSANKDHFMAILLDDEVYSAPTIRATIYNRGIIEGTFSQQQVSDLVKTLAAGSLQGRVNENPVSEKTIAPSIGEDNRQAGLKAAFWSLVAVVAFMFVYYLLAGSVANAAMLFNLLLVLGAMSFVEAVFTLPGIAGLTLSMGMAVDANVLIYERLREEQAKSQSIRMAVRSAYQHAFSAIFDSNITTIIAAMILGWVGTEEVKGFAITLGLGVLFNLFTAVSVTRWVFQWLIERGLLKNNVRMLRLIGVPDIDWMRLRWVFWGSSIAAATIGVVALLWQGSDIFGIEFSSGTQAVFSFRQGAMLPTQKGQFVPPERGQVEDDLRQAAANLAAQARSEADQLAAQLASAPGEQKQQLQGRLADARARATALAKFEPKVETILDRNKVEKLLEAFDADRDGTVSAQEWTAKGGDQVYFESLDKDRAARLDKNQLARMPERSYQLATKIANVDWVRQIVRGAFGESLDMRSSLQFAFLDQGRLERLNLTLQSKDKGITYVSADLAEKEVDAASRARFLDFVGGAMFVADKVEPPVSEEELVERIKTMRLQPDFKDYQFNRSVVIGLRSTPDGRAFTRLAVLAANPNVDYAGKPEEWRRFAEQEQKLLTAAMQREESLDSVSEFNPAVAGEARQLAIIACVLSWLAIIIYLWVRFGQARWGVAAVVCLVHDVIISVGMVALSGVLCNTSIGKALLITPVKIDPTVIAALLTIIGYSVNDTIVVFDRIRENRGKLKNVDEKIINHAINQTLSRTLLTSVTVVLALFIMYAIGGAGIHPFCYALLPGVLVGTYSSIAVAAPLLLGFKTAMAWRRQPQYVPTVPAAPQLPQAPAK